MPKFTLVRGARQLLTLRGTNGPRRGTDLKNLGLIQDGAVLIADGRIAEVGPSRRVENLALARDAQEIDASGRVVMPGFVDSYTHVAAGPARILDYEMRIAGASDREIEEAGGGPLALARAIQELSPRTLESQARHTVAEALRHGTTTLESKSGFGLTEANEIKILRVHSAFEKQSLPVLSTFLCERTPPEYRDDSERYMDWACSHMLSLIKRRGLAEFAEIGLHSDGFSVEQARGYLAAARELKFGLKIQLGRYKRPEAIRLAIEAGVVAVDDAAAVPAGDAWLPARSQIIVTLLPGALFYSREPAHAPGRMLIDSGAAIAIATGYHPATSPSQNMQMMIAIACHQMGWTAAEAVSAATINGAFAVGRGSSVGTLESGKNADLLILGVPDYREIPYHFGVNLVELVMKRGAVVVERSEVKWPNR